MKNTMKNTYWCCLFFLVLPVMAGAQVDTTKSPYGTYRFEGEDVVFEFDVRAYEKAVRASDSTAVDFADLKILTVAVQGDFNKWSEKGWKMKRLDTYRFELRKPTRAFKDAPNWQFKFVINGTYFTDPQTALRKKGMLGWYDLQNPNVAPVAKDTGNVAFILKGFKSAKKVILTGSFNNWDEHALEMKPTAEGWSAHLTLLPADYEYKFIVDSVWMHDPGNPEKRYNEYNTFNSVLRLAKTIHFELKGFSEAQNVHLAGNFNNWDPTGILMNQTTNGWSIDLPLGHGKHLYKFIVDGDWMTDPANPRAESDLQGNLNSVILVR